jgi:transglutaminase-like putative cysteine protease
VIYDIKLLITYQYASPAEGGRHVACVVPLDDGVMQTVQSASLRIDPPPAEQLDRLDFFGNSLTEFSFRGPHDGVTLALEARVTRGDLWQPTVSSLSIGGLRGELAECREVGPDSPLHFVQPSSRVPQNAGMTAFAKAQLRPGMRVSDVVRVVGNALHQHMRFDPEATTVATPAAEAFAKRRGVCQDFSHIMIACLRGIGVPAGYVSGFLRTTPPLGKPRLEGADAMHAWVRAWCGRAAGWIEFDPTNNCGAGRDHIVVARGRDYSDVAPIRGAMRISGSQKSSQRVDVIPLQAD